VSWEEVKLKDIFEIARGGSPRPIDKYITDDPNGVNWISIKDASNSSKYIFETEKKIIPEGVKKSRLVKPDDFLLTNSMSFGRPYILKTTGCIHDGWLVLSGNKEKVNLDYFYHLLSSDFIYRKFTSLAAGAVVKNLNTDLVRGVTVPLPPLPEQRRIAAILDKADELGQKRRLAIEKLDQLLQATFIDMFGDPVSNPKGWDVVKVSEIISDFIGGKNIECPEESDSPYRILKVSAVTSKNYKYFESKAAPTDFLPVQEAIVRKGDLLFSRANTTELVAATAYVWETPENMVLPDKLWKFIIKETNSVNTLYLWELFKNAAFRCELSKLSSGTSGSMKNISKSKLKEMTMICPPKDIQDHYGRISLKVWQEIGSVKAHQSNLELLFASLQQRAFSGNL
jgi:type I restriction enzyme S subunit